MSRPRAATSLQIKKSYSWALNFPIVSMRADCTMSPCKVAELKPCFLKDLLRISTSFFRLQNTSAFLTLSCFISLRSCARFFFCKPARSRLVLWVIIKRPWVIVLTKVAGGEIVISFGLIKKISAKRLISAGMVAEKNKVWRILGMTETIFSTSGIKPMSSIRSASSITNIFTSLSNRPPRS